MPIYEYKCDECGHVFEEIIFHETEKIECPKCSGQVHKLMSQFSIEVPDEMCAQLPRGRERELCTECRQGGSACPYAS